MKTSFEALVVTAIITLVMGLMSPTAATEEEGTCILKAYPDNVYLVVYDWDNDGNRGGILWQGRLNAGKCITINAPHSCQISSVLSLVMLTQRHSLSEHAGKYYLG